MDNSAGRLIGEQVLWAPQVPQLIQRRYDTALMARQHPVDRSVSRPKEHVSAYAEKLGDIGVDDSAMARDHNSLTWVSCQDSLESIRDPATKIGAGLGVRIDIPSPLTSKSSPRPVQFDLAHHIDRALVGTQRAEHVDFSQNSQHDHTQPMVCRDSLASAMGTRQLGRIHGVDRNPRQGSTGRFCLTLPEFGQRRVTPFGDGSIGSGEVLLSMANQYELGPIRVIGQECAIDRRARTVIVGCGHVLDRRLKGRTTIMKIGNPMPEAGRHAIVADQLLAARQAGRLIESLDAELADAADGYAAQDALIDRAPWSVVGWKVGATTPAAMKMFGTDEPFCGPIFEGNLFYSAAAGGPINLDGFNRPMVEGEFALVLGADLPARPEEYSSEEISSAVSAVRPAIEIVDFRLETFATAGLPAIVADCSGNGGLAVGPATNDWVGVHLESAPAAMTVGDELTGSGVGSDAFGHPIESLRWLANHLSQRGRGLVAGDTITTGSCTGIAPVAPGQTATADFGDLGQVVVERN